MWFRFGIDSSPGSEELKINKFVDADNLWKNNFLKIVLRDFRLNLFLFFMKLTEIIAEVGHSLFKKQDFA